MDLLEFAVTSAVREAEPVNLERRTRLFPSFTEFKHRLAHQLDGYVHAQHIGLIDRYVTRLLHKVEDYDAEPRLLVINMPPQHSKSLSICEALPAYYLGHWPDYRVVLGAHSIPLARRFSRRVRRILRDPVYQAMYPARISNESSSAEDWDLEAPHYGGMKALGVASGVSGHRANLLIVDDVYRHRKEAQSPLIRDNTWEGFVSDLWTRQQDFSVAIVIGTRWHPDDLTGRILARPDDFHIEHLRLPAMSEGEDKDPLGRPRDAALWPERFSQERLVQRRRQLGSYNFSALYQQDPLEAVGALFQRDWLQYTERRYIDTDFKHVVVAIDPATSVTSSSDETGIVVAALRTDDTFLVLDDLTFKGSPREWAETAIAAVHRYRANTIVAEANQGGDMVLETLRSVDPSVRIRKVHARVGKALRFQPIASLYEHHQVWHEHPFPELELQMIRWAPTDRNSPDRLDAACHALTELYEIQSSVQDVVQPVQGLWRSSQQRDRGGPRL